LDEIKEALIGFAIANKYLPCPAVSSVVGSEALRDAAGNCPSREGYIPWVALGVSKLDSWGRIFRYSVTPAFSNNTTLFTLSTARDITVKTRDSANALINLTNAGDIPAVILSHGKNGYLGATDTGSIIANASALNPDEITNAPPSVGTTFVSRSASGINVATIGEFDDIVTWLSPNILFNRMVAAGKLP
jgi:hypothetical protein